MGSHPKTWKQRGFEELRHCSSEGLRRIVTTDGAVVTADHGHACFTKRRVFFGTVIIWAVIYKPDMTRRKTIAIIIRNDTTTVVKRSVKKIKQTSWIRRETFGSKSNA